MTEHNKSKEKTNMASKKKATKQSEPKAKKPTKLKKLEDEIAEALGVEEESEGELGVIERKTRAPDLPAFDDPRAELRHLVLEHRALTTAAVRIGAMSNDKVHRETGELIPCRLPDDTRYMLNKVSDALKMKAVKLTSSMERCLESVPIYQHFLKDVFGCGPGVAAYLVTFINIHRAEKPSALKWYCGMGVHNGHLSRRGENVKGYNQHLRVQMFFLTSSMIRNIGANNTTKYLKVWGDYLYRMKNSERVDGTKVRNADGSDFIRNSKGQSISAKGFIRAAGWHKAADVFLEDLYIIWRTLEGLPVWPSYYASKLGYAHGGKIEVNAPKHLTLEEAKALVGNTDKIVGVPHGVFAFDDIPVADLLGDAAE